MSDSEDNSSGTFSVDHSSGTFSFDFNSSEDSSINEVSHFLHALENAVDDIEPLESFETILEVALVEGMHQHEQQKLLEVIVSALKQNDLDPQIVRLLIQRYPQVTQMRYSQQVFVHSRLLLHTACEYCAPLETIQLLLEIYPNGISLENEYGELPLHSACSSTNPSLETIELLISRYPDALGTPAYHLARLPLHVALK